MNYYTIHNIDAEKLAEQFKKYMDLTEKSPYRIAQETKVERRSILSFIEHPTRAHYRTAAKIKNWVDSTHIKLYGQTTIE